MEIKKSITVQYEDNSYGKTELKSKVFTGTNLPEILKDVETFRYNGGYIIKNKDDLTDANVTYSDTAQ